MRVGFSGDVWRGKERGEDGSNIKQGAAGAKGWKSHGVMEAGKGEGATTISISFIRRTSQGRRHNEGNAVGFDTWFSSIFFEAGGSGAFESRVWCFWKAVKTDLLSNKLGGEGEGESLRHQRNDIL